jgi:hypothetical protein
LCFILSKNYFPFQEGKDCKNNSIFTIRATFCYLFC